MRIVRYGLLYFLMGITCIFFGFFDLYPQLKELRHLQMKKKQYSKLTQQANQMLSIRRQPVSALQVDVTQRLIDITLKAQAYQLSLNSVLVQPNGTSASRLHLHLTGKAAAIVAFLLDTQWLVLTDFQIYRKDKTWVADLRGRLKTVTVAKPIPTTQAIEQQTIFCPYLGKLRVNPKQNLMRYSLYDLKLIGIVSQHAKPALALLRLPNHAIVTVKRSSMLGIEGGTVIAITNRDLRVLLPSKKLLTLQLT